MKKLFLPVLLLTTVTLQAKWIKLSESMLSTTTHLEWQDTQSILDEDIWKKSRRHCEGLTLAGHSDWRLPTKEELLVLAKDRQGKQLFSHLDAQFFWSLHEDEEDPVNAFTIYIKNAHLSSNDKCETNYAICVRPNYGH